MAVGDVHVVNLPYFITLGKKRYSCNLNQYRQAHYKVLNALKRKFKDLITDDVLDLPENMQQIKVHYRIFYENNRKFDIDNVLSVMAKFSLDALTELGRIPDDNYEHVLQVAGTFGGIDRDNPRVEMRIKEI